MSQILVNSNCGVTLAGAGDIRRETLEAALSLAPRLVAADGGADHLLAMGHEPECVIGDLDSLSPAAWARLGPGRLHRITEQDTTDFDKALRSIAAPFVLAVGFTGNRLDHTLGMFNVLVRHGARRCVALGVHDLCFVAPRELALRLAPGTRLSLFPMGEVHGHSQGLRWPLDGVRFAPGGMVGISNMVDDSGAVQLSLSAEAMLVLLPAAALEDALAALRAASG
ncbi:thiamine diphosphokinase [Alkalilacustris brevis]|uniref:thiamine diphosphokinase n=1 Tax=Alkalilacustris brevis TaxID=2026338 RepID=UPI000E0DB08B|nr:thiamine diphosphokinase [Alkalilacustris brevis]